MSTCKLHTLIVAGLSAAISYATPTPHDRESPSVSFVELSARKVVDLGDHTATFVKVRPPTRAKAAPLPSPKPLTEAERARLEELETKAHAVLNVTATVYLNGKQALTELRWRNEESGNLEYVAYSNADFRLLTQITHLETDTTVYSWFPFVFEHDISEWVATEKSPVPASLNFSTSEVEYFVDERTQGRADQDVTLAGLDYLHAYYQLHFVELKAAYEKRITEEAERQRSLIENPPIPDDTIIRFWKVK